MAKMRSVQVPRPNGDFELVERDIPEPRAGTVRIKVQACGICHSDSLTKEGTWPGLEYSRVPGHEVAGIIVAVGDGVRGWTSGQRVGSAGTAATAASATRAAAATSFSVKPPQVLGITYDGGYADYMIAPAEALALIPDDLSAVEAGPLMCAGITTFNSLRHSGAGPGDLVAVLGVGGLGHLGVQFAAKMGFDTVAIARGADKGPLARQLGARHYIDSALQDPAAELTRLGGAKVILATATSGKAFAAAVGGLALGGKLIILGVTEPFEVQPLQLLGGRRSIAGWPSGSSIDSQDTLRFSALTGVRSMNEVFPLERAAEAYARMMSGKARFRVVLTTGQ